MQTRNYTDLDREIFTLAAVWNLIDSMVNYSLLMTNNDREKTELRFNSSEASKLFLIMLADFLSLPKEGNLGFAKLTANGSMGKSYLGHLESIRTNPQLKGNSDLLLDSVEAFARWLDGHAVVDNVWLPSIDRNGTIKVERLAYLKVCGNISKHNFTRLDSVVRDLRKILLENGTQVDELQAYLVIPEFQEWFQTNIFHYSSTTIAWHLNEIRWGVYEYLSDEFRRAYTPTEIVSGAQMYRYEVPSTITHELVKSMYWDLMNSVRSTPYFPRFTVSPILADRY